MYFNKMSGWFLKFVICLFLVSCVLEFPSIAVIISNEELTSITDASFVVTWTTTDDASSTETDDASSTEIEYGISTFSTIATVDGTTKYHYCTVSGLSPNTLYKYRVKSGSARGPSQTVTTLAKPSGALLFSFAVMNDIRYAEGKSDTVSSRGSPYGICQNIVASEVTDINNHSVAFTVLNGNLAESANTYGDQAGSASFLKGKLAVLNGASDLPAGSAYKYLPVPGYHDKKAAYTTNWIADSFKPLTSSTSIESTYGYNAASSETESVFNYSFAYNHYNFVFLDSVKTTTEATGNINTTRARDLITAEARKTFVFTSFPAYDFRAVTIESVTHKDYPLDIPTVEGSVVAVGNAAAFRATLEAIKDANGYPNVAAVISGHLTDNYLRDINNISYVRQGPAVQFPTGYSIYKVYTNGYIKTFYKTTGRDSNDKPYYESARDSISAEGGVPKDFLTSFWLGTPARSNFTYAYPFIPGVSPEVSSTSPADGNGGVSLNKPITITFNKKMSTSNISSWVDVSPSVGALTAAFDSTRTTLTVNHASNFEVDKTYTVTVLKANVLDEGLGTMEANHSFTFNTNSSSTDSSPPTASVSALPSNTTTDPFPVITGAATDESGITNVEYRVDGGAWLTASALDGTFNSTTESFSIRIATALSSRLHKIEIRTTDAIGNITASSFASYSFTVAEEKPVISVLINGVKPLPGDPISANPRIEIAVNTTSGPPTGNVKIGGSSKTLTFVKVDTNYYSTPEISALSDGTTGLTVEAADTAGKIATFEVTPLHVQTAQDLSVHGVPLSYPNPFDPGTTQETTISYSLSKASDITLTIHDLSGTLIAKKSFNSGDNGGRAGYNTAAWNGKSDSGSYAGNGIYVYFIIGGGKVASKGKLTVLKR